MLASMASFAVADALVKLAAQWLSPAQVTFYLMGGGLLCFCSVAVIQRKPIWDKRAFMPVLLIRYCAEITGMVGMVTALAFAPLSTVGAVTQATPLLTTLGAVLFLNERIGWRRWACIATGFVGVLMIVQPTTQGFDSTVLWAVLALIALSLRDLTTRLTPSEIPSLSLAAFTMIALTPVALLWVLVRGESPIAADTKWVIVAPMMALGSLGYILLINSLRMAAVSVVMPFRFSRVVFLLLIGIAVFDERPDPLMLTGALLIVTAGAYALRRDLAVTKQ